MVVLEDLFVYASIVSTADFDVLGLLIIRQTEDIFVVL